MALLKSQGMAHNCMGTRQQVRGHLITEMAEQRQDLRKAHSTFTSLSAGKRNCGREGLLATMCLMITQTKETVKFTHDLEFFLINDIDKYYTLKTKL